MIADVLEHPTKDAEGSGHTLKQRYIFWLCLCLGVVLRLWLSTLGHNFDLESYWLVSELVEAGRSVYAETARYNYGPLWFLILKPLREITRLVGVDDIFHFHVIVATFLTLVDLVITIVLKERYGLKASLFFILNPVSILITGYHSQFDNLAILIGWIGCCHLSRSQGTDMRKLFIGTSLLGLSLATKHVLLFFPFWLWGLYAHSSPKARTIILLIPWLTFLLFFVPFLFDTLSVTGIIENVIQYNSPWRRGLTAELTQIALSSQIFSARYLTALSQLVFVLAVILSGPLWIAAGRHPKRAKGLMLLYLVTLVAFSSSMANQYLSIPLIALARYYRVVFAWLYSGAATYLLLTEDAGVFGERFSSMQVIDYSGTQVLLILVLVTVWRKSSSQTCADSCSRN